MDVSTKNLHVIDKAFIGRTPAFRLSPEVELSAESYLLDPLIESPEAQAKERQA